MAPRGEVDPDLCVALGAAIQGAAIAGEDVSAVLVDWRRIRSALHAALGELDGELYPYGFVPIIAKQHADPGAAGGRGVLLTVVEDQARGRDQRLPGREPGRAREHPDRRVPGGRAPSRGAPGNQIILDPLALDRDGILQVTAKEKRDGPAPSTSPSRARRPR